MKIKKKPKLPQVPTEYQLETLQDEKYDKKPAPRVTVNNPTKRERKRRSKFDYRP